MALALYSYIKKFLSLIVTIKVKKKFCKVQSLRKNQKKALGYFCTQKILLFCKISHKSFVPFAEFISGVRRN